MLFFDDKSVEFSRGLKKPKSDKGLGCASSVFRDVSTFVAIFLRSRANFLRCRANDCAERAPRSALALKFFLVQQLPVSVH